MAVLFHMRLTRPLLGLLLVVMGLSVILRDQNRNVIISSGMCLVLCAVFFATQYACKMLGDSEISAAGPGRLDAGAGVWAAIAGAVRRRAYVIGQNSFRLWSDKDKNLLFAGLQHAALPCQDDGIDGTNCRALQHRQRQTNRQSPRVPS